MVISGAYPPVCCAPYGKITQKSHSLTLYIFDVSIFFIPLPSNIIASKNSKLNYMKKTFTKIVCLAVALFSFGTIQAQDGAVEDNEIFKLGVEAHASARQRAPQPYVCTAMLR